MDEQAKIDQQATGLAIGHIVSGVLLGGVGLLFLGHVGVGVAAIAGMIPDPALGSPLGGGLFGAMFLGMGLLALAIFEGYAVLSFYAAACFLRRKHRTFLIVVQILNLFHQPLGTVLGVLGLVWLMQAPVARAFEDAR